MSRTVAPAAAIVVVASSDPGVLRAVDPAGRLLPEEEARVVTAHEDAARAGRYGPRT
jgi:hypothetical protein